MLTAATDEVVGRVVASSERVVLGLLALACAVALLVPSSLVGDDSLSSTRRIVREWSSSSFVCLRVLL